MSGTRCPTPHYAFLILHSSLLPAPFHAILSNMTIEQTIGIPANHRLVFDVPREIPTGATARCEIHWFPRKDAVNNLNAALEEIWALCKDAPVTVDGLLEERRRDNETEEARLRQFFFKSGDGN